MYINKIKISNFKSIYDPLELDFTLNNGFWKISGAVGAGKTTIGEAIIFGLFGSINGKNNKDLISWGEKHCLIEVWCESKGKQLYIYRENNSYGQSTLNVYADGEEIIFTNKRDAQQQLETEYFDVSRATMELLCIISFNNFKSIATLGEKDTRKFIDQVLGFSKLTELIEYCKEFKKENYKDILSTQTNIARIEAQIEKIKYLSNEERISGNINEINSQIKLHENQIDSIKSSFGDIIKDLQKSLDKLNQQLTTIVILGKQKAKEISFIEKGICPTCGAPIDQSQLDIKKQEREILLQQHSQINAQIGSLSSQISTKTDEMNKSIDEIKTLIRTQKNQLIRLEEQEKRLSINLGEIEVLEKELVKVGELLTQYTKEDKEWEQLFLILSNDVRSNILSSFLPIFNENIKKYSAKLRLPYEINFDSKFKCLISVMGCADPIPISSLSTGQLKIVDMVVILGLLGTIVGSSSTNIMFLDELFSNLDISLRNDMCILLKNSIKPGNTIFIISHQDIPEELLDGEISIKLIIHEKFHKKSLITCKNLK